MGEEKLPSAVEQVISKLEFAVTDSRTLVLEELRRYKDISDRDWPLPVGYRQRLAPSYIAFVYSKHSRAEDFGDKFISDHGLEDW